MLVTRSARFGDEGRQQGAPVYPARGPRGPDLAVSLL